MLQSLIRLIGVPIVTFWKVQKKTLENPGEFTSLLDHNIMVVHVFSIVINGEVNVLVILTMLKQIRTSPIVPYKFCLLSID